MMCCRLRTFRRTARSRSSARRRCGSWPAGTAKLVIAPVEAACMRLFARDYYAALALRLRVGEEHLPEMLVEHLLSVGYTRVDVVEMPGQVTMRGGILDVYWPEMERPVRIDFFGDEIESIRRFDPETQRSSSRSGRGAAAAADGNACDGEAAGRINARLTRRERRARRWKAARRRRSCRSTCACGGANGRGDDLSGVGVLCGGGGSEIVAAGADGPADAGVCGRACDGGEPGRALVEQGGAAA